MERLLKREVMDFIKNHKGHLTSSDMQTLAMFVEEHSEAIAEKLLKDLSLFLKGKLK